MKKEMITIVGAGISGLYSAYKILAKNKYDIQIFEKEINVGGRLSTILSHNMPIDLGAARFNHKKHQLLSQLITEMQLAVDDYHYSYSESYPNHLIKELSKLNAEQKTSSFKECITRQCGEKFFNHLIEILGFDVLKNNHLSMSEAFRIIDCHPELRQSVESADLSNGEWKKILTGFQSLTQKLNLYLIFRNVSFHFSHEIISITETKNQYEIKYSHMGIIKKFFTRYLVLALPLSALNLIETNIAFIKKTKQYIATVSLCKIYINFNSTWWNHFIPSTLQYITSKTPLRRIYFSHRYQQIFIYSDSESARDLNRLYMKMGLARFISYIIKTISEITNIVFPIPTPDSFYFKYWPNGVSFWKKGTDSRVINEELLSYPNHLFLVSDMFSVNSGWIEGALQNIEQYLNKKL